MIIRRSTRFFSEILGFLTSNKWLQNANPGRSPVGSKRGCPSKICAQRSKAALKFSLANAEAADIRVESFLSTTLGDSEDVLANSVESVIEDDYLHLVTNRMILGACAS